MHEMITRRKKGTAGPVVTEDDGFIFIMTASISVIELKVINIQDITLTDVGRLGFIAASIGSVSDVDG